MLFRGAVAACSIALSATAAPAQDKTTTVCTLAPLGAAQVAAVGEDAVLKLQDGRELKLAGIEVARGRWSAEAITAVKTMTAGRSVALLRLGAGTDRYGRTVAVVAASDAPASAAGTRGSVQNTLLAQGLARVAAKVGDAACATELHTAERAARTAGLGLWSAGEHGVRQAGDPAAVLADRGHLAVVEGKVGSVRESGGVIYLNFGRRWSEDFTVTVLKRNERNFSGAGMELKKLSGRHVRIRGTVEERGGPWIEATRPEQIELAERP